MPRKPTYTREEIKKEMLEAIENNKIFLITHVYPFLRCGMTVVKGHGLNRDADIRAALQKNRKYAANYLLQKWISSGNPTLEIAAMRVIGGDYIRRALMQSNIDITTKGKEINVLPVDLRKKITGDSDNNSG